VRGGVGGAVPKLGRHGRPAVRPVPTHTRALAAHARTRTSTPADGTYAAGPELAHAHRPLRRRRQLFRVHTTGAGTEPASSIPRRAVDVGPTRVNQCEDDRRRVALRTVFFGGLVCVCFCVCVRALARLSVSVIREKARQKRASDPSSWTSRNGTYGPTGRPNTSSDSSSTWA